MTVAHALLAQFRERAIDFIHRDWASLDFDQTMGITLVKSDYALLRVDGNAIAIVVVARRGDDWTHRNIFEFADAS